MNITKNQKGFTVLELVIVTLVIGLLGALILVSFSGIDRTRRNTQRRTDIKEVADNLEIYAAKNTFYPTQKNLNDSTFVSKQLKGLNKESLRDPLATDDSDAYSFLNGEAAATRYGYVPTTDNGDACDNITPEKECTKFTLSYKEEGGELKKVTNQ